MDNSYYSLEESERIGMRLFTIFKNEFYPLGSFLLDPVEDKLIIPELETLVKRINESRGQSRAKEERIRLDERKGK